jgi:hypothetical protein
VFSKWSQMVWLKTGTGGGMLWTQSWIFGFRRTWRMTWSDQGISGKTVLCAVCEYYTRAWRQMSVQLDFTARCEGRSGATVRETTRCVQIRSARWEVVHGSRNLFWAHWIWPNCCFDVRIHFIMPKWSFVLINKFSSEVWISGLVMWNPGVGM